MRRLVPAGVPPTWAAAAVALWLLLVDNLSFWQTFWRAQTGSIESLAAGLALAVVMALLATAVLRLAGPPRVAKIVWASLLLVSALAAHFVDGWGVLVDKSMIRNVLQTDVGEAGDLVTVSLVLDVLLRGVLPAAAVLLLPLRAAARWDGLKASVSVGVACLVGLLASLAAFYPLYASTFRNHREMRLQLVPANYLGALYGVLKPRRDVPFTAIATDARRELATRRPLQLVLVVGETARADNFSLGGYDRKTNSALDGRPLMYFSNVTSCGTDTATSLPCMFSDLGVDRFTPEAASSRENVLDLLQRLGIAVRWIENNSGCKGVCDRVPSATAGQLTDCAPGGCFDDALAATLGAQLSSITGDAVIVMHQQGSHGPAYFKRYPPPARFEPACRSNRLQECDRESVVNAYDNTIDYTSQVLARKIDELSQQGGDRDLALLYVSDHGESLGERGVYLHGMPRWLAPHEQSHVPMLLWMSEGARARLAPDPSCGSAIEAQALTHDNLFHTLLGMFGVQTSAYRVSMDALAPARGAAPCPVPPASPVSSGPQFRL